MRRTQDAGRHWVDCALPESAVFSLAVSSADGLLYAGTEPSRVFRSDDRGETWRPLDALLELPSRPSWSFPPRPWTSHVRWIAPSPHDGDLLLVGIELGGLMRSDDGGATWEDHRPGAQRDVHSLAWHPGVPGRAYEAGGGGARSASTQARAGSQRTKAGIATTPGRPQSIRTTPTVGTCRRVPGRSPLTAAATRRHCSIGDAGREPGDRSVEDCPSPCRRCPMRSSPRGDSSSPASPTGRSGRATTAETAGPRWAPRQQAPFTRRSGARRRLTRTIRR